MTARRARRTALLSTAVLATLLGATGDRIDGARDAGATAASAAAATPPARAVDSPLQRAAASRPMLRARVALTLRDAALVRHGTTLTLRGTPTGRGQLVGNASLRRPLTVSATTLATVLRGIAGGAPIHAKINGRTVLLARPVMRGGRFTATVRSAGLTSRPLSGLRLRATIVRRVDSRGRCVLVPLSGCARQRLPLLDALRADLRGIDLRGADLHRAALYGANLAGADLRGADLRGADLVSANLTRADLRGANLADAQLVGARLGGARLTGTFLCRAQLPGRVLRTPRTCGGTAPRDARLRPRIVGAVTSPAASPSPKRATAKRPAAPRVRLRAEVRSSVSTPRASGDLVQAKDGCYFYSNTKDKDGDGLSNCYEATKRSISVRSPADLERDGNPGQVTSITSGYDDRDSDDDKLDDGRENTLGTDPSRKDSDSDGLGDKDELDVWGSDPLNADTDGDSAVPGTGSRSSRLFDGAEVQVGSSPDDRDSDGDGRDDQEEIVRGGGIQLPTVADLPQFTVGIDPTFKTIGVSIGIERTTGTTTTKEQSTTKLTSEEQSQSHGFSAEFGFEASQEFETKGKVGVPSSAAEESSKFGFKESVTVGQTNKWSTSSSRESEFGKIQSDETSAETKIDPLGCLEAELLISNPSDVGFKLRGIQVLPKIADRGGEEPAAAVLTTLQPVQGAPGFDAACQGTAATADIVLPPGGSQEVVFQGQVDSGALLEYIADPAPMTFVMGKYEIVGTKSDSTVETSYLPILEDVNKKDASVVIDFGDRPTGPSGVQQYQVAANVRQQRGSDGQLEPAGVSLGEVLPQLRIDGVKLDPRYGPGTDRADLQSLGGLANAADANDGLWTTLASPGTGVAKAGVDFPDIRLKPGQAVFLRYLSDRDDDGVPDATETIDGTDDTTKDTDADGLTDQFETKVGWTVPIATPFDKPTKTRYRVISSPLSCDADADGSPDGPGKGTKTDPCPSGPVESTRGEKALPKPGADPGSASLGTDPKAADTNRDGIVDPRQSASSALQNVPPGSRAPIYVAQFGGRGGGGGTFRDPSALAVDRYSTPQRIWVDDLGDDLVQSFSLARPKDKPPFEHLTDISDSGNERSGIAVSPTRVGDATRSEDGQLLYAGRFTYDAKICSGNVFDICKVVQFGVGMFNGTSGKLNSKDTLVKANSVVPSNDANGSPVARLDVDGNRNLYVATSGNATGKNANDYDHSVATVAQYSASGARVRTFGFTTDTLPTAKAGIVNPTGVAVDSARDVYVTQSAADPKVIRGLRKFDAQSGGMSGFTYYGGDPAGVGVDCDGYVYVLDRKADAVHKYTMNLTYLTSFGKLGSGNGQFNDPIDLDVDAENNLYVLDKGNLRVQSFTYPFLEGGVQQKQAGHLRGCVGPGTG